MKIAKILDTLDMSDIVQVILDDDEIYSGVVADMPVCIYRNRFKTFSCPSNGYPYRIYIDSLSVSSTVMTFIDKYVYEHYSR